MIFLIVLFYVYENWEKSKPIQNFIEIEFRKKSVRTYIGNWHTYLFLEGYKSILGCFLSNYVCLFIATRLYHMLFLHFSSRKFVFFIVKHNFERICVYAYENNRLKVVWTITINFFIHCFQYIVLLNSFLYVCYRKYWKSGNEIKIFLQYLLLIF